MLGVPSLPALPGLLLDNSAVLLGDKGPVGLCRCPGRWPNSKPCPLAVEFDLGCAELVDESDVCSFCANDSLVFFDAVRLDICLGSPRRVALGS